MIYFIGSAMFHIECSLATVFDRILRASESVSAHQIHAHYIYTTSRVSLHIYIYMFTCLQMASFNHINIIQTFDSPSDPSIFQQLFFSSYFNWHALCYHLFTFQTTFLCFSFALIQCLGCTFQTIMRMSCICIYF